MIHLHTHSHFSLLDGAVPVRELVDRAQELGMSALALTDHNGLYGAIEFYDACLKAGIRPIIGAQVSLSEDFSLVLLAKNLEGYQNLCALISKGRLRGGHLNFSCRLEDVIEHRDGLHVLSGGKKGQITQLVARRRLQEAEDLCRFCKDAFAENFTIELQRFEPIDDIINERLQRIAKKHAIPLVTTNDVHLVNPQDLTLRRVLHAIDRNTLLENVESAGSREQYLKSPGEMQKLFRNFPQALQNTERIAEACKLELSLGKPVFPLVEVPDGETSATYLRKLCLTGLSQCYEAPEQGTLERLNHEIEVIHRLGFADYFLIVKDIVDFCRRESIPCVGRGSAADSLVSYVLGITFADPIRFKLYFERFLNEERSDPPDIDLDICWKSRDRVLKYVYQRFGGDKTAMICTFSTFQSRAAIREVAKVYGLPEEEIKRLTRHIPYMIREPEMKETIETLPELKYDGGDHEVYRSIVDLSKRLADFPRHLSIHSGGVIIAPDKLTNYTPVEVAGKGWVISQYDMYSIEKLGLVKMDLLGVRALSIITDCLALARKDTHAIESKFGFLERMKNFSPLDLNGFPETDSEVLKMVNEGLTMGCFQLESPLMRGTLRKMQVRPLEDFPVAIAIIRPGVAHTGKRDQYIRHRGGLEPATYLHESLKDILEDTYGVPVFQEQVMQIAGHVAGFSLSQADGLRRAMTKSRKDKDLAARLEREFIEGALAQGYPLAKAREIWQYLFRFTGFGFNKAHAATYGILAYQTAFLKRYFPVEFMVSVLNNPGAFYSNGAYISECRRLRIPLLPPDVNRSEELFTKEGEAIRAGLYPVFELTDKTRKRIVEQRKERAFADIYDFIRRTEAGKKEVEHLVRCGALRSLHPSEPALLIKAGTFFKTGKSKVRTEYLTQKLKLSPYSHQMCILHELELLGFSVTAHPLALYEDVIPWKDMVSSPKLETHKNRRIRFTGWYVTNRTHQTGDGKRMLFLTLEDLQGFCDIVFFPDVFARYREVIDGPGPYTVTGKLQSRMKGEANLVAEKVERWPQPSEVVCP